MSNQYYKELNYKQLSKKEAYHGKRIRVEEIEYLNGNKQIYREQVIAGDAVIILPVTEDNQVIMVQEPRPAIGKIIISLPAGLIDAGEEPGHAARRELEEETGFLAENIQLLRTYYSSIGYSDEKIFIYLAKDMKKTQQHLDEEEDIQVITIPLEELEQMVEKNEIEDASTVIAVMHYLLYKKENH